MAGKPTTTLSWFARRRMESSTCRSWSMNDKGGKYFAGAAVHTRQYPINEDGEMVLPMNPRARPPVPGGFTESRVYGRLATRTFRAWCNIPRTPVIRNACYRYAELGGAYQDEKNECGLSGQYARFQQGSEYSLEVTWKRQLTESISLQPSFQYIKNDNGDFTALSARLYVKF